MENNIDSIFNNVASKKINYYRLKKGYSLEKVVNKMKNPVSRQMLFKYENNLARMKNSVFNDICNALEVNPIQVMQEINRETNEMARNIFSISKEPTFSTMVNPVTGETEVILTISTDELNNAESKEPSKEDLEKMKKRMKQCGLEESPPISKLDILYNKTKDILNDDERAMIEATMERAIKKYEEEKNKGN